MTYVCVIRISLDYKLHSKSLIFGPDSKKACLGVTIIDDNDVEISAEVFEISLILNSLFVRVDQEANKAVITILDNDKCKLHVLCS